MQTCFEIEAQANSEMACMTSFGNMMLRARAVGLALMRKY